MKCCFKIIRDVTKTVTIFQIAFHLAFLSLPQINEANDCAKEGYIKTSELDLPQIINGCAGSYFQIIVPNANVTNIIKEYQTSIHEEIENSSYSLANILFEIPFTLLKETKLASKSSRIEFSLTNSYSGDSVSIYYKEINRTQPEPIEYNYGSDQIILDPIKPNHQEKQYFGTKLEIQKFRMSWNFSSASSENPVSSMASTFGFIAIRNSNGKVNLVSGPSGSSMKFAVGMPQRNISDGSNNAYQSKIDIITQNDPEEDIYTDSKVNMSTIYLRLRSSYKI